MSKKRKRHSAEFKARIAMEAIKGLKTVHQIAAENEVHPTQVSQWKSQLQESASGVFAKGSELKKHEEQVEVQTQRLERKVGQLAVENDWLRKKCRELGIDQ